MVLTNIMLSEVGSRVMLFEDSTLTHIAVGTGSATAVGTGTALSAEVLRKARQEISIYPEEDTTVVSMFMDSTEANSETLKEVGTFDDATTGSMYNRHVFDSLTKDSTKEVWIDIQNVSTIEETT